MDSNRRSRAAALGRLFRRGFGRTAARRSSSSRSRAAARFWAWVVRPAVRSTPSTEILFPARALSRAFTSSGRVEPATSKRSSGHRDLVDVLTARAGRAHEPLLELVLGDPCDGVARSVRAGPFRPGRQRSTLQRGACRSRRSARARAGAELLHDVPGPIAPGGCTGPVRYDDAVPGDARTSGSAAMAKPTSRAWPASPARRATCPRVATRPRGFSRSP